MTIKFLRVISFLLLIGTPLISYASCISVELKRQAMDMEAFTPPELWKKLKNTPVPAKLKSLVSNHDQWKMVDQMGQKMAKQYNEQISTLTETERLNLIQVLESQLMPENWKSGMGIWQMILTQSTIRCLKRGENL